MGAKTAGSANLPATGGNDVPAFDIPPPPPMPQAGGNSTLGNYPTQRGTQLDQFLAQNRARQQPMPFTGIGGQMGPGMPPQRPQVFPGVMPMPGGQRPLTQGVPGMGLGGQGPRPQMSQDDILRMMYMSQLGRAPEQGGMDYWRQQMANGMTPDQVRDYFRASQEGQAYQQRMRPMTDDFGGRGPMGGMFGGPTQQRMSPEVLDAMRLAYERNRPQRTYTPEEWSATFGPNVEPDPRMIRQDAGRQPGQLPSNVSAALALLGRLGFGG